MAHSFSSTTTDRLLCASLAAHARPTAPAPTTTASMSMAFVFSFDLVMRYLTIRGNARLRGNFVGNHKNDLRRCYRLRRGPNGLAANATLSGPTCFDGVEAFVFSFLLLCRGLPQPIAAGGSSVVDHWRLMPWVHSKVYM